MDYAFPEHRLLYGIDFERDKQTDDSVRNDRSVSIKSTVTRSLSVLHAIQALRLFVSLTFSKKHIYLTCRFIKLIMAVVLMEY